MIREQAARELAEVLLCGRIHGPGRDQVIDAATILIQAKVSLDETNQRAEALDQDEERAAA